MTKRSMWILLAVLANLALLPLTFATPEEATAESGGSIFFHCCKEAVGGDPYCCGYCCILTFDCLGGGMCDGSN